MNVLPLCARFEGDHRYYIMLPTYHTNLRITEEFYEIQMVLYQLT